MSAVPLDLTGEWDGVFNYPRGLPPRGFRATLRDQVGAITGETMEESDSAEDRGATLVALLDGRRNGDHVHFAKRYDALARAHYAVVYEGQVSGDGEEITGRWTIPGVWSGAFLMARRGRISALEAKQAEETAR